MKRARNRKREKEIVDGKNTGIWIMGGGMREARGKKYMYIKKLSVVKS